MHGSVRIFHDQTQYFLASQKMSTRENSSGWQNGSIFSQFKLFLSISPRATRGPTYTILFAQPNFLAAFGYTQEQLPMPLHRLYSRANESVATSELEMHLISGANHSTYLNLVDANGNNLSCYVQVMAGGCARVQDPTNPSRVVVDRFTTMTVNSASRIGNANLLRLMVTDPVAQRRLLNERVGVPSVPTPVEQASEQAVELAEDRPPRFLLSSTSGSNTSTESFLTVDNAALPAAADNNSTSNNTGVTSTNNATMSCNNDFDLQCTQREIDKQCADKESDHDAACGSPRTSAESASEVGAVEGL